MVPNAASMVFKGTIDAAKHTIDAPKHSIDGVHEHH